MRFLLDQNLPHVLAAMLAADGHDAVHARDLELSRASDTEILEATRAQGRVLVSADTDFGELLARSNAAGPSVVLLRRQSQRRAGEIAALLIANLPPLIEALEQGSIVVLDDERIRVRRLPL